MSECQLSSSEFLFHNQAQINACWQEAERVGMSEDFFRRLVHGWEETRLSLDYLHAALRQTKAEGEDVPESVPEPAQPESNAGPDANADPVSA